MTLHHPKVRKHQRLFLFSNRVQLSKCLAFLLAMWASCQCLIKNGLFEQSGLGALLFWIPSGTCVLVKHTSWHSQLRVSDHFANTNCVSKLVLPKCPDVNLPWCSISLIFLQIYKKKLIMRHLNFKVFSCSRAAKVTLSFLIVQNKKRWFAGDPVKTSMLLQIGCHQCNQQGCRSATRFRDCCTKKKNLLSPSHVAARRSRRYKTRRNTEFVFGRLHEM